MNRQQVSAHWFRRDLRLHDNHALWHALRSGLPVLPIFIFDTDILDDLQDKHDRRVDFIHSTIATIKAELEKRGGSLLVEVGAPLAAWARIVEKFDVRSVHTNRDHEPYGVQRDTEVEAFLRSKGIGFNTYKDHSVFERNDVLKDDGLPYTVFTPYMRKWRTLFLPAMMEPFRSEDELRNILRTPPFPTATLKEIGFLATDLEIPNARLDPALIHNYADTRNLPAVESTSRLSTHLRFGTVSVREALRKTWDLSAVFGNELIWREFFMQILWHFPHVVTRAFKPAYDSIPWHNNTEEYAAWCEGRTGYPIVDAGMRELNATGLMHNRVRMVTASFLTKHLLVDWRWGEAWFAAKLLDFELSSNNGNWQWASGSGCDAAPYFRVFSPAAQTKRFDPDGAYIGRWVPERDTDTYPRPIVDHDFARKRALSTYRSGLASAQSRQPFQQQLFI
ncbi:MAG: deoxyribodipyrimidine photo-lyase [Flavobacteriales bacterium]